MAVMKRGEGMRVRLHLFYFSIDTIFQTLSGCLFLSVTTVMIIFSKLSDMLLS